MAESHQRLHSMKQGNQTREEPLLHSHPRSNLKRHESAIGNTGSDRSDLGERTQSENLGEMAWDNLRFAQERARRLLNPHFPAAGSIELVILHKKSSIPTTKKCQQITQRQLETFNRSHEEHERAIPVVVGSLQSDERRGR